MFDGLLINEFQVSCACAQNGMHILSSNLWTIVCDYVCLLPIIENAMEKGEDLFCYDDELVPPEDEADEGFDGNQVRWLHCILVVFTMNMICRRALSLIGRTF